MLTRPRRIPTTFLGFLGLLIGLLIAVFLGSPRLVSISPSSGGTDVPALSPIVLTFNQPMAEDSVEARLTITPLPEGNFIWQGNALRYEPTEAWPEGTTVTVHLAAGARAKRFLPMLTGRTWSFTIGHPRILYLWPAGAAADLYARAVGDGSATRITDTELGVHDYSLGADGTSVLYTAERADGSTDLRMRNLATEEDSLVFACPSDERCQSPALSAGGSFVAFERLTMKEDASGKSIPEAVHVWVLALLSEGDPFAVGPEDHITSQPNWSPGGLLSYYDNTLGAIVVAALTGEGQSRALHYIPTQVGNMSTWSPDGLALVFPELIFPEEETAPSSSDEGTHEAEGGVVFYSHLYRFDLQTGTSVDISAEAESLVEDASPVYSPDGRWIAFGRKYLEQDEWTLGRQVWVMRTDGSLATKLTLESTFNHSSLAWRPDASALAYMRADQTDFTKPAEIWVLEMDGLTSELLVVSGYLPTWIP
jgi:Tol biopolymer transport system component